jgi:hypothetical protein
MTVDVKDSLISFSDNICQYNNLEYCTVFIQHPRI